MPEEKIIIMRMLTYVIVDVLLLVIMPKERLILADVMFKAHQENLLVNIKEILLKELCLIISKI